MSSVQKNVHTFYKTMVSPQCEFVYVVPSVTFVERKSRIFHKNMVFVQCVFANETLNISSV